MVAVVVLSLFLLQLELIRAQKCDLACPTHSPCRINRLSEWENHGSNMHCSCSPGWTGILCDTKYESCSSGRECYHGECVLGFEDQYGNEQLFCKCEQGYSGKYCEKKIEEQDRHYDPEDTMLCGDGYCLNGGACVVERMILNDGTESSQQKCDCTQAFDGTYSFGGLYCQYKSTSLCSGVDDAVLGPSAGNGSDFCLHHGSCKKDGSCDCLPGWTGRNCQLQTSELEYEGNKSFENGICGETRCYNGGSCVESEELQSKNGSLEVRYRCDCSTAFDEKFLYAGTSCEFPSTTICSVTKDVQDLEGRLFCTNHGTCMDEVELGCKCPAGFYGFSCEFETRNDEYDADAEQDGKDWEVCGDNELICLRGGKCRTTITHNDFTNASETIYTCDCTKASSDNCQFTNEKNEMENTGEDDIESQECGKDLLCPNGGKCITSIIIDKNGGSTEVKHCRKETPDFYGNSKIDESVHEEYDTDSLIDTDSSTDLCDYPGKPLFFCLNWGKCIYNQSNPGCACPLTWEGLHCEVEVRPSITKGQSASKTNNVGMIIVIAFALLLLLVLLLVGIQFWIIKEVPAPPKDISSRGTFFPRRQRRARFGESHLADESKKSVSPTARKLSYISNLSSDSDVALSAVVLSTDNETQQYCHDYDGIVNYSIEHRKETSAGSSGIV